MDFSFSSDQDALRDLSRQILSERCTPEHLRELSMTADGTDLDLWRTMAASGLVGIALPEAVGGGGLGFIETSIVCAEVARAGNAVPAFAVMALGAQALAGAGMDDALAGVADGERIVTAALHEAVGDVYSPSTVAAGARLTGQKVCVPAGTIAHAFVVSASDGLYLVEAGAPGLTIERQDTTTGVPEARLTLDNVEAKCVAGLDGLAALIARAEAVACVMVAAACETALSLTTEYAKTRVQFDRAIATFQAVSQRIADAYIDTEAIRLTAWQVAWRISEGLDADVQVASAKFWAAEGGQRVVHAAHHVHGGVGVDRDYPLHRYFLMVKQLELQLGSANPSLVRLGRLLAG
jgi:3-oxocholest-4-en-26-oyl-CoA dehydrogenase beta subunit